MEDQVCSSYRFILTAIFIVLGNLCFCQQSAKKIIGFFTALHDQAHISFVHEANKWFTKQGSDHHFIYDSTNNWNNLNDSFLKNYSIVIFLDTRPEDSEQRHAFERYMQKGGGWIGFHFSAFALTPSDYPDNWHWYQNEFLCSGSYLSNTWPPVAARLKVELPEDSVSFGVPALFTSSVNEWYAWKYNLRLNKNIKIIASIDSSAFPVGKGPKQSEIWYYGDYPVVWRNTCYKMIYFNMGHNDIDYNHNSNKELSFTFGNAAQDKMILNSILWLLN